MKLIPIRMGYWYVNVQELPPENEPTAEWSQTVTARDPLVSAPRPYLELCIASQRCETARGLADEVLIKGQRIVELLNQLV